MPSLYRWIPYCFLVVLLAFPAGKALASYPTLATTSPLSIVGPYDFATSSGLSWGLTYATGSTSREFITIGQQYQIRQTGTISRVRLYVDNTRYITGFYIKIWRKNADNNYDLVGTSNNLVSNLSGGSINTIDLTSPITGVQEGDFYGYIIEWDGDNSQDRYNFIARTGLSSVTSYYLDNNIASSTNYNWTSKTAVSGSVLPIELYMTPPQVVFIGDSIIAGHPTAGSFLETVGVGISTSTIEYKFHEITGYVYQNMGIGGQTTTSIGSRFVRDMVDLHPGLAVIEGGVNDLANSGTKATFIGNWTSMLAAAQADSNIKIILVLKILPWTNGTGAQMQARDDWNASLETLAANYSKAIVVDASSYVGQYRAGGDANNLWDIKSEYDSDGVHFNPAGHTAIAQALADEINGKPLSPTAIYSESTSNPVNVSDTSPDLSAIYVDPDTSDVAKYYQVQVIRSDGSWSSPLWDSTKTATTLNQGSRLSVSYGGTALPLAGLTYYQRWRFWDSAGNVGLWSNGSDSWVMEHVDQPLSNWKYRQKISFLASQVGDVLTNFPVLISTTSPRLSEKAAASGADFLFASPSISWTTGHESDRLSHEIETFSSSTGNLVAWVKIPSLSTTTDTEIYMYYGNSNTGDMEQATSTWDENYGLVQHLNNVTLSGTTGEVQDSTANSNNGTRVGNVTGGATGKIGTALSFNATGAYINDGVSSSTKPTGAMTISTWFKGTSASGSAGGVEAMGNSGSRGYLLGFLGSDVYGWVASNATTLMQSSKSGIHSSTTWVQYTLVYNPSSYIDLYQNNVLKTHTTASVAASQYQGNSIPLRIGAGFGPFIGNIDEVQFSNTARSSAWITTSYANQNDPSAFMIFSSEENAPDVTSPSLSLSDPLSQETVSGLVTIEADVVDDVDVAGVVFYQNATMIGSEVTSPTSGSKYSVSWDTTGIVDGSYDITAVARDSSGNYATSSVVTVNVSNAVQTATATVVTHTGGTSISGRINNLISQGNTQAAEELTRQYELKNKNSTPTGVGQLLITRSWSIGQQGSEVKLIQQFLNSHGFIVSKTGPGSFGQETTKFGALTKSSVIRFQKENGIDPIGIVGPATRAKIAELTVATTTSTIHSLEEQIQALQIKIRSLMKN